MARTKCCARISRRWPRRREPLVHSITKTSLRTRRTKPKTSLSPSLPGANFPSFNKLPLELRLKIWKMTIEERRLVPIRTSKDRLGFNSPTPIPAALHVCSESREVALKTYKLSFGSRTDSFKARIFFNFDQDTLYFRSERDRNSNLPHTCIGVFGTGINEQERNRIQSVVIDINTATFASRYVNLQQWKGIRELRLCIEQHRLDVEGTLQLRELKKNERWAFVKDYRRAVDHTLVPQSLPLSNALKKIAEAHLNPHSALKDILNGNGGGLLLAIVVGT
ncbi:hypothetical protein N431DRAFT_395026 [Stipitochalara longipes BDJ]|nr:hypothetical protein N431DRAFT_395026 [Stipitochalara longipes BDJ]